MLLAAAIGAVMGGSSSHASRPAGFATGEAVEAALRHNDHHSAALLLKGGAALPAGGRLGFLLCEAAYKGRLKVVRLLLSDALRAQPGFVDAAGGGRGPLHYLLAGYEEANRLDHGKPVELAPGSPPPQWAAVGKLLVPLAGPVELTQLDAAGRTPLHWAARGRCTPLARALAQRHAALNLTVDALTTGGGAQQLRDPRQRNLTALLVVAAGLKRALTVSAQYFKMAHVSLTFTVT